MKKNTKTYLPNIMIPCNAVFTSSIELLRLARFSPRRFEKFVTPASGNKDDPLKSQRNSLRKSRTRSNARVFSISIESNIGNALKGSSVRFRNYLLFRRSVTETSETVRGNEHFSVAHHRRKRDR